MRPRSATSRRRLTSWVWRCTLSQAANRRFSAIERELSAAIARGQEVKGYSVMLDWGESLDVPRSFRIEAIIRDPLTGRELPIKESIDNLP